MATEFIHSQIQRLLNEAADAITRDDWRVVQQRANSILRLDPGNQDALALLDAASRGPTSAVAGEGRPSPSPTAPAEGGGEGERQQPTSFVSGRYEVRRFLGEGAKKRVYLAHDTKLDRDVAFALIKTDGLDEEGLARIRREAQAMGRLGDHPHIVSVFDIGDEAPSTGPGQALQPYIVSQFMGGGDVEDLIRSAPERRIPLEHALLIADQICQALEHAHANGVIHRDVKPGNVWLSGRLGRQPRGRATLVSPQRLGPARLGRRSWGISAWQWRSTGAASPRPA